MQSVWQCACSLLYDDRLLPLHLQLCRMLIVITIITVKDKE